MERKRMGLSMYAPDKGHIQAGARRRYRPPQNIISKSLRDLVDFSGRGTLEEKQFTLLSGRKDDPDVDVFYAGNLDLLKRPAVSIVGTRNVTDDGRQRARRLARELAQAGVVVVSGLARGIDTAAHLSTIEHGGSTAAVIGTPLDKAYPAENAELQEMIYRDHLLLSPFPVGERVFPSNFPKRNRVMAALTDASVIVEASDTSGTLHQAAECQRLGRWLFIAKSVVDNPELTWPKKFVGKGHVAVLTTTADLLDVIRHA
jgi:DNA protecting protein DprA